jgi:hypothetical protein
MHQYASRSGSEAKARRARLTAESAITANERLGRGSG